VYVVVVMVVTPPEDFYTDDHVSYRVPLPFLN